MGALEKEERERECVRVLGVERTPHRSLCTVGGKPGREAPFISSQRTVVSVFRLELYGAETTPACSLLYTRAWHVVGAQEIFVH